MTVVSPEMPVMLSETSSVSSTLLQSAVFMHSLFPFTEAVILDRLITLKCLSVRLFVGQNARMSVTVSRLRFPNMYATWCPNIGANKCKVSNMWCVMYLCYDVLSRRKLYVILIHLFLKPKKISYSIHSRPCVWTIRFSRYRKQWHIEAVPKQSKHWYMVQHTNFQQVITVILKSQIRDGLL